MTHTGFLRVEVKNKQDKSIISDCFFDGIFKITRPVYLPSNLPLLTLIHVGGGYVDGDSYVTEVVVREAARLALTTQASTKVYKSKGAGVTQTMEYVLKENSELYVKQDPLILYKDANFAQYTNVHMSSSATLCYTDIITPGWSKDGKLFQYEKVSSKMKVFVDGKLEVFDHLRLRPKDDLEKLMVLEGFTHIGTMFFINRNVNEELIEKIRATLLNEVSESRIGISMLSIKGLSVRILANSTPVIERLFNRIEDFLRETAMRVEKIEWRKA